MKKIFGLITDNDNLETLINKKKFLYKKFLSEFGEFTVLNLKNLKLFNKSTPTKNVNIKNTNLLNKYKIYTPKNARELKDYLMNKKLTAFLNVGKEFEDFYIHRLLKKNAVNLIILMNFSGFGNATFEKQVFKNKKIFLYSLSKIFRIYLLRVLTIINLFPKISICFESNQKAVKKMSESIFRKINKIIPFIDISYYQKIIPINSAAADLLMESSVKPSEEIITFVDSNFISGDRIDREGVPNENVISKYFENLSKFLNLLSVKFEKKIVICLHPKSDTSFYKKYLKEFTIEKYTTNENLIKSFIVVFHESTAITSAVIFKKRIICLQSDTLGNYTNARIDRYLQEFNFLKISIDKANEIKWDNLLESLNSKVVTYDDYIDRQLICDKFEKGDDKVIRILKENFL